MFEIFIHIYEIIFIDYYYILNKRAIDVNAFTYV